jgi:hypothetical protein
LGFIKVEKPAVLFYVYSDRETSTEYERWAGQGFFAITYIAVLRIRIRDPRSGIPDPVPFDPRIPKRYLESLVAIFWVNSTLIL